MKKIAVPVIAIAVLITLYVLYDLQNQNNGLLKPYRQPYYIAIGDSLAAGMGVPPNMGYSDKYFNFLSSRDPKTKYLNLGHGGDTTQDLLNTINKNKIELGKATIITIHIGINDVFEKLRIAENQLSTQEMLTTYNTISKNYADIISNLKKIAPVAQITVLSYYNPFIDDNWFNGHILYLNSIIKAETTKNKLKFVDIYPLFRDPELKYLMKQNYQDDPIHPNLEGYKIIAEELIKQ